MQVYRCNLCRIAVRSSRYTADANRNRIVASSSRTAADALATLRFPLKQSLSGFALRNDYDHYWAAATAVRSMCIDELAAQLKATKLKNYLSRVNTVRAPKEEIVIIIIIIIIIIITIILLLYYPCCNH